MSFQLLTGADLDRLPVEANPWLWDDFLAPGMVTLLTSRWKAGKTTLLAALFAKMAAGGELAGSAVRAGRVVIVSEESPAMWGERRQRLGLGDHVSYFCRPFVARPTDAEWRAMVDVIAGIAADLVVIDPLAMVLPAGAENSPDLLLGTLTYLHRLTELGRAVMLLHHPRKAARADEMSPRGTGALSGFVDVLMTLDHVPSGERRRRLTTVSRRSTPGPRVIELSADGAEYALVTEVEPDDFDDGWPVLRMVMEDALEWLTRKRILAQWPEDHIRPSAITLWRWLDRAVAMGQLERKGSGRRQDPYKYSLPGKIHRREEVAALGPLWE
ncbi:MAG: AAA family ATPase [Gemmataceae bacterium]|nr:AAA family ATPase [Gemmataceae bacterium]